jgi:hypothetical protein
MAVPAYYNDGDYRVAQQVGANEYSFPFYSQGDAKSFEVRQRFRVAADKFKIPLVMQKKTFTNGAGLTSRGLQMFSGSLGDAYLVEVSDPNDIGNGIVEYVCTWASVPNERLEFTQIVYSMQFLSTTVSYDWQTPPPEPEVSEIQYPLPAEVVYSYQIGQPPFLGAPRIEILYGRILNFNNWGVNIAGQRVLAQDAEVQRYKGDIYETRAIYIRWPGNINLTTASAI